MPRRVRLDVLCEDRQHESFVRKLLKGLGINLRQCQFDIAPSGQQSAEQYVRQNYPTLVAAYRRRNYQSDLGLVVLVDADANTVQERKDELDEALESEGESSREASDRVALFVPRRNIETWIWNLRGERVDEVSSYPRLERESNCKDAVTKLVEILREEETLLAPLTPSLRDAIRNELPRLPNLP